MYDPALNGGDGPFTEEEFEDFAALARGKVRLKAGSTIIGEHDETSFCLLIKAGLVKVMLEETDDEPEQFIALRGPGELVGEGAAAFDEPRSASIAALTDLEAFWIDGEPFKRYCDNHPMIYKKLWKVERTRLGEETNRRRETFMAKERRLALLLIYLASSGYCAETTEGTAVKASQQELAAYLNVSRESVSAVMRGFKERDIARVVRGKTVICDWELLAKIANPEDKPSQ